MNRVPVRDSLKEGNASMRRESRQRHYMHIDYWNKFSRIIHEINVYVYVDDFIGSNYEHWFSFSFFFFSAKMRMKLLIVVVLLVSGWSDARPQRTGKNRDFSSSICSTCQDKAWNILSGKCARKKWKGKGGSFPDGNKTIRSNRRLTRANRVFIRL